MYNTIENFFDRMDTFHYADDGAAGKCAEIVLREWLSRNAVVSRTIERISAQGKTDANVSFKGADGKRHRVTLEIKSACGEIDDCTRSQYTAYCAEINPCEPLENQFFVFTREQWQEFINGYPGRGAMLRTDKKRGKTHIQSFRAETRPKASKKLRDYIDATCMKRPTLAEWEKVLRGIV